MIHSVLLIGQSNMGGRGFVAEAEPITDANHRLVLKNGRWQKIFRPINPDRKTSGVNLGESFAERYREDHPDAEIGLIPCADGGTSLVQWRPGSLLLDHALMQLSLAERSSTLVAVLWHQGESDCDPESWPLYEERLTEIIREIRKVPAAADVPFLMGGLGDWLPLYSERFANYVHVNDALRRIAEKEPLCGYVPAEGLSSNPDHMHFSAAGLLEFGRRYYDAFLPLEKKDRVFLPKLCPLDARHSALEAL